MMMNHEERIKEVRKYGGRMQGRGELLRHLAGKRLTRDQAIKAKCYDCEGYYADGKHPCLVTSCPLHPFHPYSKP